MRGKEIMYQIRPVKLIEGDIRYPLNFYINEVDIVLKDAQRIAQQGKEDMEVYRKEWVLVATVKYVPPPIKVNPEVVIGKGSKI